MGLIERPGSDEYASYYGVYVERVPPGDVLRTLEREAETTLALLARVPPEREGYRYAPEKWTVRDTVGHLIDAERVFSYRALSFARGDAGPLPGMEQDQWVLEARADESRLTDLTAEFSAVRRATVSQFERMSPEALLRRGTASGVEFTVRAFAYIVAGHELHHRELLESRYGLGGD